MELNRETAMRLWNKSFGKETKAHDFALRAIAKGAYGDRNSEFGWNVDHILPVSHGGKTNDSNLIITNIKTNDEKADKFPCFFANDIKFEIVKVQNHYEIKLRNPFDDMREKNNDEVNYYDSAAGVRYFKKLKGIQNKPRWVGSVLIRLKNIKTTAVVDFIERFLDEENISYNLEKNYYNSETRIVARNYNMPLKADIDTLLDKCVLLNTYLTYYFIPAGYVEKYDIRYRVDYFQEKQTMYLEAQKMDLLRAKSDRYYLFGSNDSYKNTVLINNLVVINSDAESRVEENPDNDWIEYNYIYGQLSEDLKKEVNK